jgi:hypothetical protein
LNLAKTGKKPLYRLQGLQGYLQYLQEDKKLKNEEKLSSINELLPNINSPEEKRLTIAALGTIPSSGSLERLIAYTDDPSVSEEACLAIVKVAVDNKQKEAPADLRRKALQTVVDKSGNDSVKKKAQDGIRRIK